MFFKLFQPKNSLKKLKFKEEQLVKAKKELIIWFYWTNNLEKYIGPKYLEELKDMQDNNNLYSKLNEKRNLNLDNK